jgi:hypothetical protein
MKYEARRLRRKGRRRPKVDDVYENGREKKKGEESCQMDKTFKCRQKDLAGT